MVSALRAYAGIVAASPWYHKLFFGAVVTQVALTLAERAVLLSVEVPAAATSAALRQSIWFAGVIAGSALFVGWFGVHALLTVNAFELVAFFVSSAVLLARLAAEFVYHGSECDGAAGSARCIAFFTASLAICLLCMALCVAMYTDLRWKRYKAIGAEVATRTLYARFELFGALVKLDLQFSLITLFTGLVFFSGQPATSSHIAMGLNIALFVVELAWERVGAAGVAREHTALMVLFWGLSIFQPAFLVNVAAVYWTGGDLFADATDSVVLPTIAAFAVATLVNRIATLAASVALYRAFGERYTGLRRILSGNRLEAMARTRGASPAPLSPGRLHSGSRIEMSEKRVANPLSGAGGTPAHGDGEAATAAGEDLGGPGGVHVGGSSRGLGGGRGDGMYGVGIYTTADGVSDWSARRVHSAGAAAAHNEIVVMLTPSGSVDSQVSHLPRGPHV